MSEYTLMRFGKSEVSQSLFTNADNCVFGLSFKRDFLICNPKWQLIGEHIIPFLILNALQIQQKKKKVPQKSTVPYSIQQCLTILVWALIVVLSKVTSGGHKPYLLFYFPTPVVQLQHAKQSTQNSQHSNLYKQHLSQLFSTWTLHHIISVCM